MFISEIINNPNLYTEFEYRVNVADRDGIIQKVFRSLDNDEIPFDVMCGKIAYMTVIDDINNEGHSVPCLLLETII